MRKIFVADQDVKFQTVMKSICQKGNLELYIYTSSMDILPLIEQENPDLIFMNLELPDVNDFVMFDLLKKADTIPPIPVLITYTSQSENILSNYRNMKFQPQGYHKKPIKEKDIQRLLSVYLGNVSQEEEYKKIQESAGGIKDSIGIVEDDDIIFSEVLAESDIEENPIEAVITEEQKKPIDVVFKVSNGNYVDMEERTGERERAAKLVSLEKQNHFLSTENKRLTDELESLNDKTSLIEAEFKKRITENKKSCEYLEKQIDELNNKLTDKERELIAKDHDFEKRLRKEMDEMSQETEERLRSEINEFYTKEFRSQKEANAKLMVEIAALKEIETSAIGSINRLEEGNAALSHKFNELENEKKSIENEKKLIMKKLMALEVDISGLEKEKETLQNEKEILQNEKEEKEKSLSALIEKSKKEIEMNREELKDYKNRIEMLNKNKKFNLCVLNEQP
jgi:CheY-like chemotaxis protein